MHIQKRRQRRMCVDNIVCLNVVLCVHSILKFLVLFSFLLKGRNQLTQIACTRSIKSFFRFDRVAKERRIKNTQKYEKPENEDKTIWNGRQRGIVLANAATEQTRQRNEGERDRRARERKNRYLSSIDRGLVNIFLLRWNESDNVFLFLLQFYCTMKRWLCLIDANRWKDHTKFHSINWILFVNRLLCASSVRSS